jgi:hypothetical protein
MFDFDLAKLFKIILNNCYKCYNNKKINTYVVFIGLENASYKN